MKVLSFLLLIFLELYSLNLYSQTSVSTGLNACVDCKSEKETPLPKPSQTILPSPNSTANSPRLTTSPGKSSPNPNGLTFPGTPEQQAAAKKREEEALRKQQEAYQKQQNVAAFGTIVNGAAQMLGNIGAQRSEEFNKKLDESRGNIDAVNNRGNAQFQPADDKGAMRNAKLNNGSMDEVGPGQEDDEAESDAKEINRLSNITDEQFEKERQRYLNRQTNQTDNTNGSAYGSSESEALAQNVKDFLSNVIRQKGWNWAEFTDEEKAKAAYIGYTVLSATQATIGGLLYTGGGPVGQLIGTGLGQIPVSDMQKITNPFLLDWSKK